MILGKDKQRMKSMQNSINVMSDIIINKLPQLEHRLTRLESKNELSLLQFQNIYGLSNKEMASLFKINEDTLMKWKEHIPASHLEEVYKIMKDYEENRELYLSHIIKG